MTFIKIITIFIFSIIRVKCQQPQPQPQPDPDAGLPKTCEITYAHIKRIINTTANICAKGQADNTYTFNDTCKLETEDGYTFYDVGVDEDSVQEFTCDTLDGSVDKNYDVSPHRCDFPQNDDLPYFSSFGTMDCIETYTGDPPQCQINCLDGFQKARASQYQIVCHYIYGLLWDGGCTALQCALPFAEVSKDHVVILNRVFCTFEGTNYNGSCNLEAKNGFKFGLNGQFSTEIQFHCQLNGVSSETAIVVERNRCLLDSNVHNIKNDYTTYSEGDYRPICKDGYFSLLEIIYCREDKHILGLSSESTVCERLSCESANPAGTINCGADKQCTVSTGYYLTYGEKRYDSDFTCENNKIDWVVEKYTCEISLDKIQTNCLKRDDKYIISPTCTFNNVDGYAILLGSNFQNSLTVNCVGDKNILDKKFAVAAMACKVGNEDIPSHLTFTKKNCLFGSSNYADPTCTVQCMDGFHSGGEKTFDLFCRTDGTLSTQLRCEPNTCTFPFLPNADFQYEILNPELCEFIQADGRFSGNCELKSSFKYVFKNAGAKSRYLNFYCNDADTPSVQNVNIEVNQCSIRENDHNIVGSVSKRKTSRYRPNCKPHYHPVREFFECVADNGVLKLAPADTMCIKIQCPVAGTNNIDCPDQSRVCNLDANYHLRLANNKLFEGSDFECSDVGMANVITINSCSFDGPNLKLPVPAGTCRKVGSVVSFEGSCTLTAGDGFVFRAADRGISNTETYHCSGIHNKITHPNSLQVGTCHSLLKTPTFSFSTTGCLFSTFDIDIPRCEVHCIDGYRHAQTNNQIFETTCVLDTFSPPLTCIRNECPFPITGDAGVASAQDFVVIQNPSLCRWVDPGRARISGNCVLVPRASYVFKRNDAKETRMEFHCIDDGNQRSSIDAPAVTLIQNVCSLPLYADKKLGLDSDAHLEITGSPQCLIERSTLVASVQGMCTLKSKKRYFAFKVGKETVQSVELHCQTDDSVNPHTVEIIRQNCETFVADPRHYDIVPSENCYFDRLKSLLVTKTGCRVKTRRGYVFAGGANRTFVDFECSMTPQSLKTTPIYCPPPGIKFGKLVGDCRNKVFGDICRYECDRGYISRSTLRDMAVCKIKNRTTFEFEFLPKPQCVPKKPLVTQNRTVVIPAKYSVPAVAGAVAASTGGIFLMYYNQLLCYG